MSFAAYIDACKIDEKRYRQEEAREVALIRDWLRKNLSMTVPASQGGLTVRYFSGTRVYLWNCIVKARRSLGLRKLEPQPISHWIQIVFGVRVIYDIETVEAALRIAGVVTPPRSTLAEHDATLSEIFKEYAP
jgi:hypothetical protein